MKYRIATTVSMVMITGALGALLGGTLSWGQTPNTFQPKPPAQTADDTAPDASFELGPNTAVQVPNTRPDGTSAFGIATIGNLPPQSRFGSQLSALKRKLKQADTGDAREATEEEIRQLFTSYFEADLDEREERVKDLKERIAELERQIQKRKDAKSRILDLQLEVIRNEAEGLGFYSTTNNRSGTYGSPRASAGGMMPGGMGMGMENIMKEGRAAPGAGYGSGSRSSVTYGESDFDKDGLGGSRRDSGSAGLGHPGGYGEGRE